VLLFNYRLKEQEGAVFFSSLAGETVYARCISFLVGEVRTALGGEQGYRHALDDFGNLRKPPAPQSATGSTPPGASTPSGPAPSGPLSAPVQTPAPSRSATPAQATGDGADVWPPAPRLSDFLDVKFPAFQLTVDPVLISMLGFLIAVTSYEYDAPLYEHWYRLPGKVNLDQNSFPTVAELRKMPPEKQNAWNSLVEESRQWLADKPNGDRYLRALRAFK
jgi:hypothetical protein